MFSPDESRYVFFFSLVEGMTYKRLQKIQSYFRSLKRAWENGRHTDFSNSGLKEDIAENLEQVRRESGEEKELIKLARAQVKFLTCADDLFPPLLKEIHDPPLVLYYRGNLDLLKGDKKIAVVGTRRMTSYGREVVGKIMPGLIETGFYIVSGLAVGVDSEAHRIALGLNGYTIAVLGTGLDSIFVGERYKIYREIVLSGRGLVLSEYRLGAEVQDFFFPKRNRLISGLTLGTLIVEASDKSGALITANLALEQGREVMTVPGNIFALQSRGCHKLIKEGAALVASAEDVLQVLGFDVPGQRLNKEAPRVCVEVSAEEKKVLANLQSLQAVHVDDLAGRTRFNMQNLVSLLALLELKGWVEDRGGKWYVRKVDF